MLGRTEAVEAFAVIGVDASTTVHVAFSYDDQAERDAFAERNRREHGHMVLSAEWHGLPVNLLTLHIAPPVEDDA